MVCFMSTAVVNAQVSSKPVTATSIVEKVNKGGEGGHSGPDTSGVSNPRFIEGTFTLDELMGQVYKCTDELANTFFRQFAMQRPEINYVYRNYDLTGLWLTPYLSIDTNEYIMAGTVGYNIFANDNKSEVSKPITGFIHISSRGAGGDYDGKKMLFSSSFHNLGNSPTLFKDFGRESVRYTSDPDDYNFIFPTYRFKKVVSDIENIVVDGRGAVISGIEYTDVSVLAPSKDKFNLHCEIDSYNQTLTKCTKLEINAAKYAECLMRLR
jgi:hypothetical protein